MQTESVDAAIGGELDETGLTSLAGRKRAEISSYVDVAGGVASSGGG
jgi:hypothetical protein